MHYMNIAGGLANYFVHIGDADDWQIQQVWDGIPKGNLERMLKIREDFDPLLEFRNLNWGGFKLPV